MNLNRVSDNNSAQSSLFYGPSTFEQWRPSSSGSVFLARIIDNTLHRITFWINNPKCLFFFFFKSNYTSVVFSSLSNPQISQQNLQIYTFIDLSKYYCPKCSKLVLIIMLVRNLSMIRSDIICVLIRLLVFLCQ